MIETERNQKSKNIIEIFAFDIDELEKKIKTYKINTSKKR